MTIDVLYCHPHESFSIGVRSDEQRGTRVLGTRCCAEQRIVASWEVTRELLSEIRAKLTQAAKQLPPKR